MTETRTDIAIAGGGLTGQLAALALASKGFDVTLVDRPAVAPMVGADSRTTALAYASIRLFDRLGLWEPLDGRTAPIRDIVVSNGRPRDRFRSGGTDTGALHFPSALIPEDQRGPGGEALGHIVKNTDLTAVMATRIADAANITVRSGRIEAPQIGTGGVRITLAGGETLVASLLLACDGKGSPLRAAAGFRTFSWGYGQSAIAFNIEHREDHDGVAHEIFYPQGPFAILPLPGRQSSIVWTESDRQVAAYAAMTDAQLLEAVRNRVGPGLGVTGIASTPASFPLRFNFTPTPIQPRLALAGDAFHGIHPIAGQGFNLAVKDIAALTDVLVEARGTGLDIGALDVLRGYADWRRFDATALAFGTDALTRLFSNDIAPVRWARSLGLGAVQKMDRARLFFMRTAGADTGELPSLMAA